MFQYLLFIHFDSTGKFDQSVSFQTCDKHKSSSLCLELN
jgi:hypothetical protein